MAVGDAAAATRPNPANLMQHKTPAAPGAKPAPAQGSFSLVKGNAVERATRLVEARAKTG